MWLSMSSNAANTAAIAERFEEQFGQFLIGGGQAQAQVDQALEVPGALAGAEQVVQRPVVTDGGVGQVEDGCGGDDREEAHHQAVADGAPVLVAGYVASLARVGEAVGHRDADLFERAAHFHVEEIGLVVAGAAR